MEKQHNIPDEDYKPVDSLAGCLLTAMACAVVVAGVVLLAIMI